MCNKDIRDYARIKNISLWRIAAKMGMRDSNFSRKLRFELPETEKEQIKTIIDELAAEQEGAET
ncbi:MAG: hypothetical protein LIP12_00780 [Clostridiales bacterium]|nr:hypothetical protein [Clostridiales bacterium]